MHLSNRKTILYIDDDADDRDMLNEIFQQIAPDINLIEAENGQKGLEYLNTVKDNGYLPCLIVLDINMPVLDGKQTFTRLQQDLSLKKVPVIIFTSSSSPYDHSYFNEKGIGLITKPSNINFLRKIAEGLVAYCS